MPEYIIRSVGRNDLSLLDTALRALSKELGDQHPATIPFLEQAGFGPTPAYYALLAVDGSDTLCGAVVFSPAVSTTLAATGCFISDLWVAHTARGDGLGRRLLLQAAEVSKAKWGADYLKLAVYDGSSEARAFYTKLGFAARKGETTLLLNDSGLSALNGTT